MKWAGRPLNLIRRQTRALLFFLAARLQPAPREHLCLLFWGEHPQAEARRNLTRLLTHLRRVLPEPDLLICSGDQVYLNPDRVRSDAWVFERLEAAHPAPEFQPLYQQAVELYRGPFLDGFDLPGSLDFETWAGQQRQVVERVYLQALEVRAVEQRAGGNWEAAAGLARRYLQTDELAEGMHRLLIETYAAAGDRRAAQRQFERCVVVLERELGVRPQPETRAAYQAALTSTSGAAPGSTGGLQTRATAHLAEAPGRSGPTGPDGTEPVQPSGLAWEFLENAWRQANQGQGGVVVVLGEAGLGKTHLLADFARLHAGAGVLWGASYPDTQDAPYQPLVEAVRTALGQGRPGLNGIGPAWLGELRALLPELGSAPSALPAVEGFSRARLAEALCQAVLALAGEHPLLCLDNLQWADRATLDWLAYMARRMPSVLVCAACSGESPALERLRLSLGRLGRLSVFELQGLSQAEVLARLRQVAGTQPGDEAGAQRLYEASGGNPFFLDEMLQALFPPQPDGLPLQPVPLVPEAEQLPVSSPVRAAVRLRLEPLSALARQVLEAGAVLGPSFDFPVVQHTAGRHALETVAALDELTGRRLLVEEADHYRFPQGLVRLAVLLDLSYWLARLLHERAWRALARFRPDSLAAQARHFERAEAYYRAAACRVRLGLAAGQAGDKASARANLTQALSLLDLDARQPHSPEGDTLRLTLRRLAQAGLEVRELDAE